MTPRSGTSKNSSRAAPISLTSAANRPGRERTRSFGLERYADCAAALAKALELNPDFTTPSVILTSSLGHLGKGESAAESLQIYGSGAYWAAAGISAMVIQFPYKHSADRHRVERGLRLSGIKEY